MRRIRVKYRQIYEHLKDEIVRGSLSVGDQVPTESELQQKFAVSRVTVSRAVRDLAREGYIVRHRGTGSFVQKRVAQDSGPLSFLILGGWGGIFPRIYEAISREVEAAGRHLTISHLDLGQQEDPARALQPGQLTPTPLPTLPKMHIAVEHRMQEICREYRSRGVQGVFFVPIEWDGADMWLNDRIAEILSEAGISVVLVDRDTCCWPRRSRFDLVSVDNRRCAYVLTRHLLNLGRRRIVFVTSGQVTSPVSARGAGFREALAEAGVAWTPESIQVFSWQYGVTEAHRQRLRESRADAYLCVNDHMAARMICELVALGIRVPEDVAVVGIDDVDYATLTPVAITTMRQPLHEIGRVAARVLLDRLADPSLPPREILLGCELIIRKSCGSPAGTVEAPTGSGGQP